MLDGLALTWSWNPSALLVLWLLYLWALRRAQRPVKANPEEQPVSAYRIAAL
jgi:hypothetical protein